MKVLVVCSGNICRSPMAAEYLRHRAAREGVHRLVVDSAGLLGIEGSRATPEAVAVMREQGIDLSGHRSRGLMQADIQSSDLVVVMTDAHRAEIESRFGGPSHPPVVLLRAFEAGPDPAPRPPSLDDPIGRPLEVYRDCLDKIRSSIDQLVLRLKHER